MVVAEASRSATADLAAAKPVRLSACVITHNEEDRIADCLDSLAFCDEIVVVDSHSTDRTREIAAARRARIIERDWPGHVVQKNFAVASAAHDWVLCLDADERVSPDLQQEIEELRKAGFPGRPGWRMPRSSSYLGRFIRHGSWHPDRQLRLFDRRRGRFAGRDPHDKVELDTSAGRLRASILHHPYRDIDDHIATIQRYTTLSAADLHERGRRANAIDLTLRPAWRFARFYVIELGFLDGWRGLLLASFAGFYVFLKYAKLWMLTREATLPTEPPSGGDTRASLVEHLVHSGYRAGMGSLRALPESLAYRLGAAGARGLFDLRVPRARVSETNLGIALPETTAAERRHIARESWVHLAWSAIDVARASRLSDDELRERFDLVGRKHFDAAVALGRGVLVLAPHLGNFQLALIAMALEGVPLTVVARPLANRLVSRDVFADRARTGAEVVGHRGVASELLRGLRNGRGVVVVNDQYARVSKGILVPFFGVRASTSPGPATLSLRSGAPVMPFYTVRTAQGHHRAVCLPAIAPEPSGDRRADIERATAKYNAILEELIRAHPEQWIWGHRRFRNSPDLPDALYG